MNTQELEEHTERALGALRREFAGEVSGEQVTRVGWSQFHELLATATINNFIPLLVHRQTREALINAKRHELHRSA